MASLLLQLRHSLTTRLLAVFVSASILLMILLFIAIAHGLASQWRSNVRPHLEQYLDFISAEIGNPPAIDNARALAERLPINIYIVGPDMNYSTNGEVLDIDEASFERPGRHRDREQSNKYHYHGRSKIQFGGDEDRTLLKSSVGEYEVFYELAHRRNSRQRRSFFVPALLCALVILAGCFFVIKHMLRPVRDIKAGVKQMGLGDLSHRVPIRHRNDLGELADSINTMASDIEQMLDAKRQLLLGASHELRSPLTRAKIATQLIEDSPQRQMLEDDLLEMEQLISDILESERIKTGHAALQRTTVNLRLLVNTVVADTQASNVSVDATTDLPELPLDETRIRIMLRNVIGNAVTHCQAPDTSIVISLRQSGEYLEIGVTDTGPGIAPEHIERLTEPFYRTDASRTRNTGGFGLGLYLAQLIAEAHGGTLNIESRTVATVKSGEEAGTRVTILLPLSNNP